VNHYLLRFIETGRDVQRKKQPRDLASQLPGARLEAFPGRLLVTSDGDALPILSSLHGLSSFSPCIPCAIQDLETAVLTLDLSGARSFAVKVKRFGEHPFSSLEMARRLAAVLISRWHLRVDLVTPDVVVGVEIRDQRAWVFDRVYAGVDRRGTPPDLSGTSRFYADQMLGRLAAWLRMLGYDTAYAWDIPDSELVRRANAEGRIVLTRDRPLSKNRAAHVFYVEARRVEQQVREVMIALDLRFSRSQLFQRCAVCNAPLHSVDKAAVAGRVPPSAYAIHDRFAECKRCDKIYWAGGHYRRVLAALSDLITE
jgi:uncharacterized protein with PIN domain